ncbi:sigma factor [Pseudoroseicyclus tamaricis]|uniref:Transcriptional regulator n=1 Tax=Pseudoroseicyclus tamaricis TaxID=2705421 RepID=A0A6B2JXN6_9RHOB|nr:sigma factor [Pseudoroseicyclus tamaricis]NDV00122.1 transcriptional regulator [Pseudoroseicyclus tamaricis]
MTPAARARLMATARAASRREEDAEDLLQEALVAAWAAGRLEDGAYVTGIIRRQAAMAARGAARRRARESAWAALPAASSEEAEEAPLPPLPPALERVARLAQAGCTRAEIRWLLGLTDAALRQRLAALRGKLAGRPLPPQIAGAGGARRADLRAVLARRPEARFASHDPDGHLFLAMPSQSGPRRQQQGRL